MSNNPQPIDGYRQWIKGNTIVTLTILGVLLYAVLSIPVTFFYASLGTTPSEVGFSYASILSGSTLAAAIIVAVMAIVFVSVIGNVAYAVVIIFCFRVIYLGVFHRVVYQSDAKLDSEQFALKLKTMKRIYRGETPWTEVERSLYRRRELGRIGDLTPAEESEKKELDSKYQYSNLVMPSFLRSRRFAQAVGCGIILYIIATTTLILTLIATVNANDIRHGDAYPTSYLNVFDFHAEPVYVKAASADGEKILQLEILKNERVFLLGENDAQYFVLYVPDVDSPNKGSTVRIPVADVIMSSNP
jgi:hypothetical protein